MQIITVIICFPIIYFFILSEFHKRGLANHSRGKASLSGSQSSADVHRAQGEGRRRGHRIAGVEKIFIMYTDPWQPTSTRQLAIHFLGKEFSCKREHRGGMTVSATSVRQGHSFLHIWRSRSLHPRRERSGRSHGLSRIHCAPESAFSCYTLTLNGKSD
jgi:hypothetical protein